MSHVTGSSEPAPRRTLAAIVFTDVANFSALTQQDEDRTLALVRRDLGLIRGLCEKLHGRVLKSTGDGLLLSFDSAVQAVAFALEVQQALAAQAKGLPPEQVLMHRIGIHLGDVFLSETDVMGDGVNVAARLQGQADPGGICISQTVYDVVKNRLAITATYLGPRELKNIKEAVPVYQILLDATGSARPVRRKGRAGVLARAWPWLSLGALAALVVLAFLIYRAVAGSRGGAGGGSAAASAPGGGTLAGGTPSGTPGAGSDSGAAASGPAREYADYRAAAEAANARQRRLLKLNSIIQVHLRTASASSPLEFSLEGPQGPQACQIWQGPTGELVVRTPAGEQKTSFQDLDGRTKLAVVRAVLAKLPLPAQTAQDLRQAANDLAEEDRGRADRRR